MQSSGRPSPLYTIAEESGVGWHPRVKITNINAIVNNKGFRFIFNFFSILKATIGYYMQRIDCCFLEIDFF